MRKIYYLAMAVILTVMVGCQKDDELLNLQGKTDQAFYATFENSVGTRTALDANNNVLWSAGDQISVFGGTTVNNSFILASGENTNYGTFAVNTAVAGTESSGSTTSLSANVAYYPYDGNVTVTESNGSYTFNATFPATQTYSASGTFGIGASPMVAVTASTLDANLKFKNVGAIFRLQLKGDAKISKVEFSANENLAGKCDITASHASGNTAAPTVNVINGSKTITLNCTSPIQLSTTEATNFVVAMLPVDNVTGGITVTIYDDNGMKMVHTHDVDKIERSNAYTTVEVIYNGTVQVVSSINDIDFSTTEPDMAVQVTGEVTGSQTISIPASLSTNTTSFMFDNVADDAVITINNETGGAYSGKVIIEVPVGETIPTVNANIPDGEVYIKQGSVTTLVVSSKKNTTIIGAGVKVEKLTVNQGNVRVEEGGEISVIENNTNGTLYITNAGGTLPQTLSDNTIVVYEDTEHNVALNDKYSTDNISDLMSYGKNVLNTTDLSFTLSGGNYEEVVDVTGGKNITFEPKDQAQEVSIAGLDHQSNANPSTVVVKNITLNNTLQTEGWFTGTSQGIGPCVGAWGGIFTFEKCKFIVEGTSGKETGVMTWWITNKMSLTFNNCTFDGKDNHESARAMQIYGNADLNVTGCTFNTYKEYSLKYVAEEGNVATFEGNKVYNSKYFVRLGSEPYAGSKYTVNINNTTLGEGVAHYDIDHDEDQMVYIDGSLFVSSDAQLSKAIAAGNKEINLTKGEYTLPSVNNSEITIAGTEDVVITISKPNYTGANLTLSGVTVKGSGYSTGVQHVNTVTYDKVKIVGEMCLYGEKVQFNECEFDLAANQYIWTYGAKVAEFTGCKFNTAGKAILVYNEGAGACNVTVKGCTFNATAGAKAGAIANQNCAAIEIDNFQESGIGAAHNVTANNNTYNENFSGEWRIKNYVAGNPITVNDKQYTSIAIDGKTMTIDANKNVTVNE